MERPLSDDESYIEQAVSAVAELHRRRMDGDILVFMPTEHRCEFRQRYVSKQHLRHY